MDENFKIGSLFYMDDGIIFAENLRDLTNIINKLGRVCMRFGLRLNRSKCKIMVINNNENIENIDEIDIVQNIKYLGLGVVIDNKNNCFNSQKDKIFPSGLKYSNKIYSILSNSCNRMLIGL